MIINTGEKYKIQQSQKENNPKKTGICWLFQGYKSRLSLFNVP